MATRRPLIVNAAANQIQELTDSDGLVGNGTIPIGGIIMWSGTIANIPSGWALCNGSGGTPDLRSRFIVGAGSDAGTGVTFNADNGTVSGSYAPGNTGGEVAHQLTTAEMPSHLHTWNFYQSSWNTGTSGNTCLATNQGTVDRNTSSAGADDYHENRPPYYALAFIMRTT